MPEGRIYRVTMTRTQVIEDSYLVEADTPTLAVEYLEQRFNDGELDIFDADIVDSETNFTSSEAEFIGWAYLQERVGGDTDIPPYLREDWPREAN